jgi:hypothetical protein
MKKKLLEYVAIDALGVSFSLKLAIGGIWKRSVFLEFESL